MIQSYYASTTSALFSLHALKDMDSKFFEEHLITRSMLPGYNGNKNKEIKGNPVFSRIFREF